MKPRAFSIFLTLCLCLTLLPVTAGAANEPVKYIQRTWVNNQVEDTELECIDYTVIDSNTTTWNGSGTTGGWYVVNSSITISRRVTVTGDVHLILVDDCTLTVNGGIRVAQGNSLTIYGQSGDSGQLIAQNPGTCNAGIGGNINQTAGTVTIHGGTVEATGGNSAAGIGGGSYGTGGTVTIYGGRVEATGDAFSAGIGGGGSDDGTPGGSGTFSTGQSGNAVIFASSIADNDDTNGWQGVIFQGNSGQVYGSVALDQDLTIENGRTLTIPTGSALDIQDGVTLTVAEGGNLLVYGTLNGTVTYKVTGVSLNQNTLDLTVGGRATLTATVSPENATDKTVTWESSDNSVATVSGGTVTAVGAGKATITARAGSCTATCAVTVTQPDDGEPTYSVSWPKQVEGGRVTVKKSYAQEGETFSFTVTPHEGWELEELAVLNSRGRALDLTCEGDGAYSFEMPAGAVEITVSFREIYTSPEPLPFTDVPGDSWYTEAVRYVYQNGLMAGVSDTAFGPDATTSRSMIATILWRMAGSPVVNYALNFADVPQGQWYSEAVRWAASEGIVSGYGDTFGTDDPITREQLAVMLYRLAQNEGLGFTGSWAFPLRYDDADQVSDYAYEALCWTTMNGIITGTGDGSTLSPQGQATRAQAAVMLTQFAKQLQG